MAKIWDEHQKMTPSLEAEIFCGEKNFVVARVLILAKTQPNLAKIGIFSRFRRKICLYGKTPIYFLVNFMPLKSLCKATILLMWIRPSLRF